MTVIAKAQSGVGRTTKSFDQRRYVRLLARTVPVAIRNDAECKRAIAEIDALLRKGSNNLTPEEERLLELLSTLVEQYEDETEDFPDSPPYQTLQFLMEQNDLRQVDLVKFFGSRGRVSEVVNGKRAISKAQAKSLGEFFRVSPELFI
ncbi:MAG: transcriptional regulator [Acidobacteria bacterium]|nr:transcriptional regulator [Acidobacteriota bacterium]